MQTSAETSLPHRLSSVQNPRSNPSRNLSIYQVLERMLSADSKTNHSGRVEECQGAQTIRTTPITIALSKLMTSWVTTILTEPSIPLS